MQHRSGLGGRAFRRALPWRILAGFGAAALVAAGLIFEMTPASAGVGIGVAPTFPVTVQVGQAGIPANVTFTNFSNGAQATGNVTLSSMQLLPACSDFSAACAGGTPDPGTFKLSATGTGATGTACAGNTFTIALVDPPTGTVQFNPTGGPVVLGPPSPTRSDDCEIDFTLTVLRSPTIDADAAPGLQVNQEASAVGTHDDATVGGGTGTSQVTVNPGTPTLTTQATSGTLGQAVNDTANVTSGAAPAAAVTGTVTFNLFDTTDPNCTGAAIFTSTTALTGGPPTATTTSGSFVPAAPGTYRWTAAYSGDGNYAPVASLCNAQNESSVIGQVSGTLTTQASGNVNVGGNISDTATLAGANAPTGTITFRLFGPNDATCSGAVAFTDVQTVAGNGVYPSNAFTTTAGGVYRWTAVYSGDTNNAPITSPCNAPNESVNVVATAVTIVTQASGNTRIGGTLTDTANLSGGASPTGSITFNVFGPDDNTCATVPAFTSTVPVNGNGNYTSGNFTPTDPGRYRWVATYSGDATNAPAGPTPCNDPNERVDVRKNVPTLETQASPTVATGGVITDTATLSNAVNPGGNMVFAVFGPNDTNCTGDVVFGSTVPVSGNGDYTSDGFTPTAPGTYRWIAIYSGDHSNTAVLNNCNAPNESVVVTGPDITPAQATTTAPPGVTTTAAPGATTTAAPGVTTTVATTTTTRASTTSTTRSQVGNKALSVTGAAIALLAKIAIGLIVIGGLAVMASRRRHGRA